MTDRVIPIVDGRRVRAIPPGRPRAAGRVADTRGRELRDLRISVTDHCNFRCTYCMPREVFGPGYQFLPRAQVLTFEEIERMARIFRDHGIEKIRLTGGEPLLRRNLERLVERLARLDVDLALTTNGTLLARKAQTLASAGLRRVTVSLDAIDDATFRRMNDVDFPVAAVLEGIDAAEDAGLAPVKVNMVVKRGVNDEQVVPMARHFRGTRKIVRFIEFMDVGASNGWRMDDVVPSLEILRRIDVEFPLESIDSQYPGEVAERWRYADGAGEIGVISSVTQAFCSTCTRARLSTEGMLYTCLFAGSGYDLRALLRGGHSDATISEAIERIWSVRADRYSEIRTAETAKRRKIEMSYIGG